MHGSRSHVGLLKHAHVTAGAAAQGSMWGMTNLAMVTVTGGMPSDGSVRWIAVASVTRPLSRTGPRGSCAEAGRHWHQAGFNTGAAGEAKSHPLSASHHDADPRHTEKTRQWCWSTSSNYNRMAGSAQFNRQGVTRLSKTSRGCGQGVPTKTDQMPRASFEIFDSDKAHISCILA